MSMNGSLDLNNKLVREGWSFHERLDYFARASNEDTSANLDDFDLSCQDKWAQKIADGNNAKFQKRLQWDNLNQTVLHFAFDPESHPDLGNPDYLNILDQLRRVAIDYQKSVFADPIHAHWCELPFAHVWIPVVEWAVTKLQNHPSLHQYPLLITDSAWLDLETNLLQKLCTLTDQALYSLFIQKRPATSYLISKIQAAIPESERSSSNLFYQEFVVSLLSDGFNEILSQFPVLGRLLVTVYTNWFDSSVELLRRISHNKPFLESKFAVPPLLTLAKIGFGLSDPHKSGREVCSLEFLSNELVFRCVYKPKDLGLDVAFQRYLNVFNENSCFSPFRILKVLSCDGYGFVEWVDHELCHNSTELAEFYFNSGRLLAVFYLLGCTDCHYENLIASSRQLILIDTETLLEGKVSSIPVVSTASQSSYLSDLLQDSVLITGLLPCTRIFGGKNKRAFDMSALGIDIPSPERRVFGWLHINTDSMSPGVVSKASTNLPCLPIQIGSEHPLRKHAHELVSGFSSQLRIVLEHKDLFFESLDFFAGQTRRLVSRNTDVYFRLLRQSLSPTCLRSAFSRGLEIDRLSRPYLDSTEKPPHWKILKSEIKQITNLDIPFFDHFVDQRTLLFRDDGGHSPLLLDVSGLDAAKERLSALNSQCIDFQSDLIYGAIAARYLDCYKYHYQESQYNLSDTGYFNQLLDVKSSSLQKRVVASANQLWDLAVFSKSGTPEWLGINYSGFAGVFNLGSLTYSLYSGTAGIALLFARLSLSLPRAQAVSMASKAVSTFQSASAQISHPSSLSQLIRDSPIGLSGLGGLLLALNLLNKANAVNSCHLGGLILDALSTNQIIEISNPDILQGLSGLIGPLLAFGTPQAIELATSCGERILDLQLSSGGWSSTKEICPAQIPLTGFSHGASGIAASLARLSQATNDSRFSIAALKAVDFEKSVFSHENQNWPDFRDGVNSNVFQLAWCNGAPGILLSRLIMLHSGLCSQTILDDIAVARDKSIETLKLAASRPQRLSAHLCCGYHGITSVLRIDSFLNSIPVHPSVLVIERQMFEEMDQYGAVDYFGLGASAAFSIGLFNGITGSSLALLEASDDRGWMSSLLSCGLLVF